MRAKQPVDSGYVERDGVRLSYEVFGNGPQTMVFIPAWSIGHSRVFKGMIPYFSETYRCITFDGRGNGKSDRPEQIESYSLDTYVADVLAVMDATQAGAAILVGLSFSGMLSSVIAAYHPERVKAAILTGTAASVGPGYPYMVPQKFLDPKPDAEGWNKYDKAFWDANYPEFADFFLRQVFVEPHSTKQIEDGCAWASETSGQTLSKTVEARMIPPSFDVSEAMFRKIKCPVLMIHGDSDQIQPLARAKLVAELTGAELVTIAGGGHIPQGRFPAFVNTTITEFLERRLGLSNAPPRKPVITKSRKRALYLSSPIGLGHGRRDIAIAQELRKLQPDLAIDWLAQDPVTRLLDFSRRNHPPAQFAPCQRISPHRTRERRTRIACVPGAAPHGRSARLQLHAVPGRGEAR